MKFVITGGAGFIGSQLGRFMMNQGHDVLLLDNLSHGHLDNLIYEGNIIGEFICQDICDRPERLAQLFKNADVVVHLAGISALPVCQANPEVAFKNNVIGLSNVLEACRMANVGRMIFSSTSAVYETNDNLPMKESDLVNPNLVYSLSKYSGEKLCEAFSLNYGLDIVILRFFNVYGPHQDFRRTSPPFTSYLAREIVSGRVPDLYNDSSALRDYVFVEDVLEIIQRFSNVKQTIKSDIFNVCSGEGYSVMQIYQSMCEIAGFNAAPNFKPSHTFWDRYPELWNSPKSFNRERVSKEVYKSSIGDPRKLENFFSWKPKTSLKSGLRAVLDFAKSNI